MTAKDRGQGLENSSPSISKSNMFEARQDCIVLLSGYVQPGRRIGAIP
jgi:hypothetical protein